MYFFVRLSHVHVYVVDSNASFEVINLVNSMFSIIYGFWWVYFD